MFASFLRFMHQLALLTEIMMMLGGTAKQLEKESKGN